MTGRLGKSALVLVMMISMLLGVYPSNVGAEQSSDPEKINLALGKAVTSSTSYEKANEGWQRVNLVDGDKTGPNPPGVTSYGWTTTPTKTQPAAGSPAWVEIDLGQSFMINEMILWPRSDTAANTGAGFPVDFKVLVAESKGDWKEIASYTDYAKPTDGNSLSVQFEEQRARYVRIETSKLRGDDRGDLVMQLRELEVISATGSSADDEIVQKDWEELSLDTSGQVTINLQLPQYGAYGSVITWSSSNPEVLNEQGKVKRPPADRDPEQVVLTATVRKGDVSQEKSFTFTVKPHRERTEEEEQFLIGIFWPPTAEYMNDQQYQWIEEANVDVLQNVLGSGLDTEELNMKMLDLAERHNLKVNVADPKIRGSKEDIQSVVDTYKDYWATGGYYIRDEPSIGELAEQAAIYQEVLKHDAAKNPYVNLLPNIYGSAYEQDYIRAWIKSVGKDNLKYLSYDQYPFLVNGGFDNNYYDTADLFRRVGLEYGIKTASYLQSIGYGSSPSNLTRRTPSEADLRFSAYSYMAYGFKYVTWFTYWTPTDRGEYFEDAIIDPQGNKTERYEPFKQINGEMKQLGKTLIKLDALEVYHTGKTMPTAATKRLPDNFYVHPANGDDEMIVSYMKHKETGDNYIMIVNKSLQSKKSFMLQVDEAVLDVREVSKETGELAAADYDAATGVLAGEYAPGEGKLFWLDGDLDRYYGPQEPEILPGPKEPIHPLSNMALGAGVEASSDVGRWGWSKNNVVDGKTVGGAGDNDIKGWSSAPQKVQPETTEWIMLDLGEVLPINEVRLWPRNDSGQNVGLGFPENYRIMVSVDKQNWETAVEVKGAAQPLEPKAVIHTFAPTAARYVKVEGSSLRPDPKKEFAFQLTEIEVFQERPDSMLYVQLPKRDLLIGDRVQARVSRWQDDGKSETVEKVAYSSVDPEIAVVDEHGYIEAKGAGTTQIVVSMLEDGAVVDETEVTVRVRKLEEPWQAARIGDVREQIIPEQDRLEVQSSGIGMSEQGDQLLSIQRPAGGRSQELSVKIERYGIPAGGADGRSGLMFRQGIEEKGASVSLTVSPEGRLELQSRGLDGAMADTVTGVYVSLPVELKLVQNGDQFTAYFKQDQNWRPIARQAANSTITMLEPAGGWHAGAMTYSAAAAQQNYVLFSGLELRSEAEAPNDAADVQADLESIHLGDTGAVIASLTLPTSGGHGTAIVWSSSEPSYMDAAGVLQKRPAAGAGDLKLTLTATVSKGAVSRTKTFEVTIKALSSTWIPPYIPVDTGGKGEETNEPGTGEETGNGNEPSTELPSFSDVSTSWAKAEIEQAVKLGIVKGYTDGTFKPDKPVTRAELVAMLARVLQLQDRANTAAALTFKDEARIAQWARDAVAQAVGAGIITGYDDHTFRPQQLVTRTELAVMLARMLEIEADPNAKLPFKDAGEIPGWAGATIAAIYEKGFIEGRPGQLFAPQAQATRAEVVTLIIRMLNKREP